MTEYEVKGAAFFLCLLFSEREGVFFFFPERTKKRKQIPFCVYRDVSFFFLPTSARASGQSQFPFFFYDLKKKNRVI